MAKFEGSKSLRMSNALDQVQRIQDQVHSLIERYRLAIGELESQAATVASLTQELAQERKKVADLRSEIEQLRLLLQHLLVVFLLWMSFHFLRFANWE